MTKYSYDLYTIRNNFLIFLFYGDGGNKVVAVFLTDVNQIPSKRVRFPSFPMGVVV